MVRHQLWLRLVIIVFWKFVCFYVFWFGWHLSPFVRQSACIGLCSQLTNNCHNPSPSPKSKVQVKSPSLKSTVKTLNSRTWTWSDSILLCHHHWIVNKSSPTLILFIKVLKFPKRYQGLTPAVCLTNYQNTHFPFTVKVMWTFL